jgi:hypothetical protein
MKPKTNYFIGTENHPYHLSIGAVMQNAQGEVAVHYFKKFEHPSLGEFKDLYILMRETPELGESIEETLHRGLREEFGATGEIVDYLGPIVINFPKGNVSIEKTTIYFLCNLISIDESLRAKDDIEALSELRFMPPQQLIEIMKEQRHRFGRDDADESSILERLTQRKV